MMTAAVRDLKKSHPEYQINVRTSAQELWDNNPYLDRNVTEQNADIRLELHYPLINSSTKGSHHFIHGFVQYLEEQLHIDIPTGDFCVDVHLNDSEKNDPYILGFVGDEKPYWIVDAGGKIDFTCKIWEFDRFQEVVNRTKDKINWVQIGSKEHNHRRLANVIDMVGKTNHRQFVSLMYGASGVLTPVSYPMHLSTMQWKNHNDWHRPCIVIAGSREPSQWEAYPTHRFLHNCGILSCSKSGACWKSRIVKMNDGKEQDKSICSMPIATNSGQTIPKCLDMITVDEVVRNISLYI